MSDKGDSSLSGLGREERAALIDQAISDWSSDRREDWRSGNGMESHTSYEDANVSVTTRRTSRDQSLRSVYTLWGNDLYYESEWEVGESNVRSSVRELPEPAWKVRSKEGRIHAGRQHVRES
jgi:hypothetical protein